jgi:hypothetical protein
MTDPLSGGAGHEHADEQNDTGAEHSGVTLTTIHIHLVDPDYGTELAGANANLGADRIIRWCPSEWRSLPTGSAN